MIEPLDLSIIDIYAMARKLNKVIESVNELHDRRRSLEAQGSFARYTDGYEALVHKPHGDDTPPSVPA